MTEGTASPGVATGEEPLRPPMSFRTAATWSVALHVAVIVSAIVATRLTLPTPKPPAYAVELVAAPAGPRSLGAVNRGQSEAPPSEPATVPQPPDAPDPAPAPKARGKVVPAVKAPAPVSKAKAPPTASSGGKEAVRGTTTAGGGPTGGAGRDVASVKVQGIAFPFPGYLDNVTRQIAINFKPRAGVALKAEVAFLIHRDGSVSDLRLTSRSGVYAFDLECIGAVEAVGQRRSFGPLPSGFRDDVLPVVFSFDPSVLR